MRLQSLRDDRYALDGYVRDVAASRKTFHPVPPKPRVVQNHVVTVRDPDAIHYPVAIDAFAHAG